MGTVKMRTSSGENLSSPETIRFYLILTFDKGHS